MGSAPDSVARLVETFTRHGQGNRPFDPGAASLRAGRLVYELYGLTEEEIEIVEDSTNG